MPKIYVNPRFRLTKQFCPYGCGREVAAVKLMNGDPEWIDMNQDLVIVQGPKGWLSAGELQFPAFVIHRCAQSRKGASLVVCSKTPPSFQSSLLFAGVSKSMATAAGSWCSAPTAAL